MGDMGWNYALEEMDGCGVRCGGWKGMWSSAIIGRI